MTRSPSLLGLLAALGLSPLAGSLGCTQITGLDTSYTAAIDTPCQTNTDCATGTCSATPGWCTQACNSDGDCLEGACVENTNNVGSCFPSCSTDADCGAYGVSGLFCKAVSTVDGIVTTICSL